MRDIKIIDVKQLNYYKYQYYFYNENNQMVIMQPEYYNYIKDGLCTWIKINKYNYNLEFESIFNKKIVLKATPKYKTKFNKNYVMLIDILR